MDGTDIEKAVERFKMKQTLCYWPSGDGYDLVPFLEAVVFTESTKQ